MTSEHSEIAKKIRASVSNDQKIVFIAGLFNSIHLGHIRLFHFARDQGEYVVVGLTESDSNIKTAVQVTQCLENNGKSEVYLVNNNFCVLIFTFFTIHFFTFASCNVSRVLFNQI